MPNERILITVKTYPVLSEKYVETVCTAGVREDGSWVRIYPVPFRRLSDLGQYRLYDWVEWDLERNSADPRPESYRPAGSGSMRTVGHVGTSGNWEERRKLLLHTCLINDSLETIIELAKSNQISLTIFRPKKVVDFVFEEDTPTWDPSKLTRIKNQLNQLGLFDDSELRMTFKVVRKVPYKFYYRFEDVNGKSSRMQILEWQIGALYWNCLQQAKGDKNQALAKVKQKYYDEFINKDLHFILGTTKQYHFVARNPWMIIGVLPIPFEHQLKLL